MAVMAKSKKKPDDKPVRYPSRENTRYVAVPLAMYEVLKRIADADERSTSFVARKAIREYLEKLKMWPPSDTQR